MGRMPILEVKTQENGVLLVMLKSGNRVSVDMKPRFNTYRFGVLSDPEIFASADTDGNFVQWRKNGMVVAELGFGEIIKIVFGEDY